MKTHLSHILPAYGLIQRLVAVGFLLAAASSGLKADPAFGATAFSTSSMRSAAGPNWNWLDFSIRYWGFEGGALSSNYHRSTFNGNPADYAPHESYAFNNRWGSGRSWTWNEATETYYGAMVTTWQTNLSYYLTGVQTTSSFDANFAFGEPDLSTSAGGAANGTYTSVDPPPLGWTSDSTTFTYDTTGAIFTDGPSGSTNEHFYRVKLSLTYQDQTPMPLAFVASYLGSPLDSDGNVYLWLRDDSSYPGKPTFKYATPTFYSYSAEPNRADQLGTLLISTIKRGGTWPGAYPPGIAQSMGFPADGANPSDDQLAFDYIMNSPLADNFALLINALLAARGIPLSYEKDHSRGQVGSLSDDERKYMVMVLLARSINPDPPEELDYANLDLFIGTNFVYRLVNEFSIEAAGYNDKFGHDVAGRNILRKQAKIGKTKIVFENDIILRLKIWPGTPLEYVLELGLDKGDVNSAVAFFAQFLSNEEGAGHNTVLGGQKGTPSVKQICAGRAGETLRDLEQPLLRKMPPDFYCWVIYRVAGNSVGRELKFSLEPVGTWPTFFEYHYDFAEQKYFFQPPEHAQMETPFDGFLSLGP